MVCRDFILPEICKPCLFLFLRNLFYLKIGTFKVDATGFRLGERFIKIILDNAIEQNVDEVYVTLFDDRPELETLVTLLSRWGFENYGTKTSTGEKVLTKQMKQYLPELSPRKNFPNLKYETC